MYFRVETNFSSRICILTIISYREYLIFTNWIEELINVLNMVIYLFRLINKVKLNSLHF